MSAIFSDNTHNSIQLDRWEPINSIKEFRMAISIINKEIKKAYRNKKAYKHTADYIEGFDKRIEMLKAIAATIQAHKTITNDYKQLDITIIN